MTDTEPSVTVE